MFLFLQITIRDFVSHTYIYFIPKIIKEKKLVNALGKKSVCALMIDWDFF